jgi:hypothetical protein
MASAELVSGRVLAALTGRPACGPLRTRTYSRSGRPAWLRQLGTLTGLSRIRDSTRGDHVEAWLRLVIERPDDILGGSGWQHQFEGPFGFGEGGRGG